MSNNFFNTVFTLGCITGTILATDAHASTTTQPLDSSSKAAPPSRFGVVLKNNPPAPPLPVLLSSQQIKEMRNLIKAIKENKIVSVKTAIQSGVPFQKYDNGSEILDPFAEAIQAKNLEIINFFIAKTVKPESIYLEQFLSSSYSSLLRIDIINKINTLEQFLQKGFKIKSQIDRNLFSAILEVFNYIEEEKALTITKKILDSLSKPFEEVDELLVQAMRRRLSKVATFLIQQYAKNQSLYESLLESIRRRESKYFDLIILNGANVDFKSSPYDKLIHHAATSGCIDCIKSLYKKNDFNLRNQDGETSLHLALNAPYLKDGVKSEMIRTLITLGADPSIKNKEGLTPLEYLKKKPTLIKDAEYRKSIEEKLGQTSKTLNFNMLSKPNKDTHIK